MKVIYEDKDVIVVAKSSGEVVHHAPGYESGTMCDALVAQYPEMAKVGSVERPGVVHRLDRDTSGVMVFARTERAYLALRQQFESHVGVEKEYLAVCHGSPKSAAGVIETPIKKGLGRNGAPVPAKSRYRVLARKSGVSLIDFTIETGRRHQVRIHAAELGCPILGDAEYGSREKDSHLRQKPRRALLHAVRLVFCHPADNRRMEFTVPPPNDIVHAI